MDNFQARLKRSIPGASVPNTFALFDDNGVLGGRVNGRGNVWFVDPQNGSDSDITLNDGRSWQRAFASMSPLDDLLGNGDVICLSGVLQQQWTAPIDVFDVTILGVAGRPRQATDGGVPTGGGATWLPAAASASPLLTLREQGWTIYNIFFNIVGIVTSTGAAIRLHREEISAAMDASHASIVGCRFGGGNPAIEDYGGNSNIYIADCTWHDCTYAIRVTNQGIAIPSKWLVERNFLQPCTNGWVGAWVDSCFQHNFVNKSTTTTINAASGNTGLRNHFFSNHFNIAAADFDPTGGITGNATDFWYSFLLAGTEFGQPAD